MVCGRARVRFLLIFTQNLLSVLKRVRGTDRRERARSRRGLGCRPRERLQRGGVDTEGVCNATYSGVRAMSGEPFVDKCLDSLLVRACGAAIGRARSSLALNHEIAEGCLVQSYRRELGEVAFPRFMNGSA